MDIKTEYKIKCTNCGVTLDIRDFEQALSHGIFDEELGEYICIPEIGIKKINKVSENLLIKLNG